MSWMMMMYKIFARELKHNRPISFFSERIQNRLAINITTRHIHQSLSRYHEYYNNNYNCYNKNFLVSYSKEEKQAVLIQSLTISKRLFSSVCSYLKNSNHNKQYKNQYFPYNQQQFKFTEKKYIFPTQKTEREFSSIFYFPRICKNHLRHSSYFSTAFEKRNFSLLASHHRNSWTAVIFITQQQLILKCFKKSKRLLNFRSFITSKPGMMVWVSDYDKPDPSVMYFLNISFLF